MVPGNTGGLAEGPFGSISPEVIPDLFAYNSNTFLLTGTCDKLPVLMISPGIYIRKDVDFLEEELSGKPGGMSCVKGEGLPKQEGSGPWAEVTAHLREHHDGWCHIELAGDEKGVSLLLEFLTGHKSLGEVLVWDFNHDLKEYSYSFFRKGKVLEHFSVRGPVLDSVSFVSDLRKVQLKDLINGLDFAREAVEGFGLRAEGPPVSEGKQARLGFSLPPKRSFWQKLLGSLSGHE